MAFTSASWDSAKWTICRENAGPAYPPLPWAFVRLGDVGEERQYVVPTRHIATWAPGAAKASAAVAPRVRWPPRRRPRPAGTWTRSWRASQRRRRRRRLRGRCRRRPAQQQHHQQI